MPTPPHPSQTAIPESLRLQLADFRRHLWRIKILEAGAAGIIGLLVSFLLVYGLDRVWPTPGWVRLVILVAGVSLVGGFAPYWLHRWVWRQRRESQLARLIAQRLPGLGDRLLGVIELQHQHGSADSLSPSLRQAAMAAVADETLRRPLETALPSPHHRRWSLTALALAAITAALITHAPRAGMNALHRWLMPLATTERYTFTKLTHPPTYLAVAFGEAFDVTLQLAPESEHRPIAATGRYGQQPSLTGTLHHDCYHFTFPGQQSPGTIAFRVGDLRHDLRVDPLPRPAAASVSARVTAPSYLHIPERSVALNAGVITAVEGSQLSVELAMTRPLAGGSYGPTHPLTIDSDRLAPPVFSGALEISGMTARTPPLVIGAESFVMPMVWTDQFGLAGDSGFRLQIDAIKDAPPTSYLQGIDRQKVILPEETVDFETLAEDDFGVKSTGIAWSGQFTRPTHESPAHGELKLSDGGAERRHLLQSAAFSPAAMGIAPQKITLRAYADDYFPGRARTYSEPVILYVLTRDEHAQMLKNRFDRQISELEDLARREQSLLEENQRLDHLDGTQLQQDANRKRLGSQHQEEAESQRRIDELTQQMEQLMKDSARNGDIDPKTLQKLAESLKSLQELSQLAVPKVRHHLANAQEPSNTTDQSHLDVQHAVEEQSSVVEKMQRAIDKAHDANRRFEAGTFVNRLNKAASEELGIIGALKDAFSQILGVKASDLDPADAHRLNESVRQQSDTTADVRWIQEDLGHYFARTQTESFKQLLDSMHDAHIDIGLEDVRTHLTANHSYQAAEEAQKWADQLAAWAHLLDGSNDPHNGNTGGGSGSAKPSPEDDDFEFILRVMKLIQKQQDLRSRTRVLEQFRRSLHPPPPANRP